MRPMQRAIHLDFHTMPLIGNFLEHWDPERFAEQLERSHVRYINAFAKCNEGFAYYPTEIGVPYPGMKCDMLGELIRECHKRNIGVSAYLNVGYDQEQAIRHREWRVQEVDHVPEWIDNYFIDMCYYHSGYRKFLHDMTQEILDRYDPDGLFYDCMGIHPCRGIECTAHMDFEGDINNEIARKYARIARMDFCREIKELAGTDKYLYFNGVPYDAAAPYDTHIEIEGLPGGQGYDYFPAQMAYARKLHDNVLYMTGRFQMSWADFGGLKGQPSLENDLWDAVSNGAGISVGDHMDPVEGLEPLVYDAVEKLFDKAIELEPWTNGAKYVSEIGILTIPVEKSSRDAQVTRAHRGCVRMLGELDYPCDIVNEDMDLSGYRLLILPDDIPITPLLREKLAAHLACGKSILSTGLSGLDEAGKDFAMPEWGVSCKGKDDSISNYYRLTGRYTPGEHNEAIMRWAMYDTGLKMEPASDDTQVLAEQIAPYFQRRWDGLRGWYYTPPTSESQYAAVTRCGNVAQVSFQLFTAYYTHALPAHKALIDRLMTELLPEPILRTSGIPSTARVTLTQSDSHTLLHVKVTHPEPRGDVDVIEEHSYLPAGAKVRVRGDYTAVIVPDGTALASEKDGNYTEITLPEICGYLMIELKK